MHRTTTLPDLEPYAPTMHAMHDVETACISASKVCSCGWSTTEALVPGHQVAAWMIVDQRAASHLRSIATR